MNFLGNQFAYLSFTIMAILHISKYFLINMICIACLYITYTYIRVITQDGCVLFHHRKERVFTGCLSYRDYSAIFDDNKFS